MTNPEQEINWQKLRIPALVGSTALRLEMIADRLLFKPLGLTAASFRILAVVDKCGALTPTSLMGYLGGTKSNMTQRLSFLNRAGLIKTSRVPSGDQRKILVSLTPAGRSKVKETLVSFDQYNSQIEKFFSKLEIKNFINFVMKLNRGLDACEKESHDFPKSLFVFNQ